ncbi:MAG: DUF1351 domain-containing protein [Lachnospiraceae bacterium]|nr:DUF1351 domain-containing protein [Lachnospiraceae bacterium]
MNELRIADLEKKDITTWDFARIKGELESALAIYDNAVYTDATIKSAKDDKATLAKAKKLVEDRRKEFKETCLAPYAAVEPQIKELVAMIEEKRVQIDEVVKDYTERQKQAKERLVRACYDKNAKGLGIYANVLYGRILDPRWLNKTTKREKYQEEMLAAINKAEQDIKKIQDMESPFVDVLIDVYAATLSVDEVKSKHEELMQAMRKAGLEQVKQVLNVEKKEDEKRVAAKDENSTTVRFFTDKSTLGQILNFAKFIGADYEICGE